MATPTKGKPFEELIVDINNLKRAELAQAPRRSTFRKNLTMDSIRYLNSLVYYF